MAKSFAGKVNELAFEVKLHGGSATVAIVHPVFPLGQGLQPVVGLVRIYTSPTCPLDRIYVGDETMLEDITDAIPVDEVKE